MAKKARFSTSSDLAPNWACLVSDLLILILDKLVHFPDYIRFTAVCKSWNSIASSHKKKRDNNNHQLPWLLIRSLDKNQTKRKLSLRNFTGDQMVKFELQIPKMYKNKRCVGSSHGWLVFVGRVSLIVLNPLSGGIIDLPPLTSSEMIGKGLGRVLLSRDPSFGSFEVIATSCCGNVVAHLKLSDEEWTYSKLLPHFYRPSCLIFYENHILGVSEYGGGILSLELISGYEYHTQSSSRRIKVEKIFPNLKNSYSQFFLLETPKFDLLMVDRDNKRDEPFMKYSIFKITVSSGQVLDRVPIVNLGGHSLFLGRLNDSISVLASDYHGCKPNWIYYCDSYTLFKKYKHLLRRRLVKYGRIEGYDLDDQNLQYQQRVSISHEASWIVPSMKCRKV